VKERSKWNREVPFVVRRQSAAATALSHARYALHFPKFDTYAAADEIGPHFRPQPVGKKRTSLFPAPFSMFQSTTKFLPFGECRRTV